MRSFYSSATFITAVLMAKAAPDGSPGAAMGTATTGPKDEPAPDATAEPVEILRKVNPKDVMGQRIKDLPIPADLYTVIGRANNLRDGESNYGPWTSLRGEFEAVRLSDGKRFYAPECFIPGPAGELLVNAVRGFIVEAIPVTDEQKKKGGQTYKCTGEFVELALIVSTKASTREGGAAYEFATKPIVEVRRADALAALRDKMAGSVAKLKLLPPPAPEKKEKTAEA